MSIIQLESRLWDLILSSLLVADYRHLKRAGVSHEFELPCITCWFPVRPSKQDLFAYECSTINEPTKQHIYERCMYCCSSYRHIDSHESIFVCDSCGVTGDIATEYNNASYNASYGRSFPQRMRHNIPRRHTTSYYKRLTHFKSTLLRLQAKENISIHQDYIVTIKDELKKLHLLDDPRCLTFSRVKTILKTKNLQKYYNHVFYIIYILTGRRLFELNQKQTSSLCEMFVNIQIAFANHRGNRVNMLSYLYLIKKLTGILGWTKISKALPLLKSRAKVYQQDLIWKAICQEMSYPFFPSVA